jgi:hypothetical protein
MVLVRRILYVGLPGSTVLRVMVRTHWYRTRRSAVRRVTLTVIVSAHYCSVSTKGSLFSEFSLTEMTETNSFELLCVLNT